MSLRPDGKYRCDRCGVDVGNAGVIMAAKVADITTNDDGQTVMVNYDFCRVPNSGAPAGCAEHVLVPSNLTDYAAQQG